MLYGLYQSAQGADLQKLKMDTVANNIANAGTSTFKRDLAVFGVREQQAVIDGQPHHIPPGMEHHAGAAVVAETFTDHSQGPLQETGGTFDAALLGEGFFRVTDGEQEFLTRRGSFTQNANFELVEADTGLHVLDDRGEIITVPPNTEIQYSEDGFVLSVDPVTKQPIPVAKFDLVQADDLRLLQKLGDSLYGSPEENLRPAGADLRVRQGYIEQSGVQPINEMLSMIETSRAFEANMNMIQHQENTLGQLLQAMGRR